MQEEIFDRKCLKCPKSAEGKPQTVKNHTNLPNPVKKEHRHGHRDFTIPQNQGPDNEVQGPRRMQTSCQPATLYPIPNYTLAALWPYFHCLCALFCARLSWFQAGIIWNYISAHHLSVPIHPHSIRVIFFYTSKNPIKVKILRVLRLSTAIVKSRCPWRLTV